MAKQARGVRTMERVLDAALECFTEHGVEGATIQDLAARADVSIGSLYHHFGERDRIAFVLYLRCMASLLAACADALAGKRSARTGVHALVTAYLEWVGAHPDAARFIYAAGQTRVLDKWHDELFPEKQRLAAPIFDYFRPYIERGDVTPLPFPFYEILLIGPPAEFARRYLGGVPDLTLDDALRILPDTVWRSVRA